MHDPNQREPQIESSETSVATTQELPRGLPDMIAPENEAAFLAGQEKIIEMPGVNGRIDHLAINLKENIL